MTQTINLAESSPSEQVVINATSSSSWADAVSGNIDLNGDGFKDALFLVPNADYSAGGGEVFIVDGNNTLPGSIAFNNIAKFGDSIQINSGSGYNLCSISGLGNINNGKYDSFIVGFYQQSSLAAYVYYGNSTMKSGDVEPNIYVYSGYNNYASCYAVSSAGYFNNNTIPGLMVGVPGSSKAFVVFGSSSFSQSVYLTSLGTKGVTIIGASGSRTGASVANIGDFNDDGVDDIFVGATAANNYYGGGYAIWGGKNLPSTITISSLGNYGITFVGESQFSNCGFASTGIGDFNGDGVSDFALTCSGSYTIYLVLGSASLASTINLGSASGVITFTGSVSQCSGGYSISGNFDFNNDGLKDLLIGCVFNYIDLVSASVVIFGSASFPSSLDISSNLGNYGVYLNGYGATLSVIGTSVSAAGKITDSEYDSVIVTTYYGQNADNPLNITASIVYGGPASTSTPTTMPVSVGTPSLMPTSAALSPSLSPTNHPTMVPTTANTHVPTATPVIVPTLIPTPSPTSNITTDSDSNSQNGLAVSTIIGLSVGLIGGVFVIAAICYFAYPSLMKYISSIDTTAADAANNDIAMNVMHKVGGEVVDKVVDA